MATSQRNTHFCGAKLRLFALSTKHLRHYFQKLFGFEHFEHFAFQGATLANLQNVRLSVYSVVSLPSLIFSILVFLNAAVCTLLYSICTGEP